MSRDRKPTSYFHLESLFYRTQPRAVRDPTDQFGESERTRALSITRLLSAGRTTFLHTQFFDLENKFYVSHSRLPCRHSSSPHDLSTTLQIKYRYSFVSLGKLVSTATSNCIFYVLILSIVFFY